MPTKLDILGQPKYISGNQAGPNGPGSLTASCGTPPTNNRIWILKSASVIYFDPAGPSASPTNRISGLFLCGNSTPVNDAPFDFAARQLQLGAFEEVYVGGGGSRIGFSASFVGEAVIFPNWTLKGVWSQGDGEPSGAATLLVSGVVLEHVLC